MAWLLRVEVANWKVVSFLAVAAAVAVFLFVRAPRRRALLLPMAFVLLLVGLADGVNTYFGYLPQVADVLGVQDWPTVPASALTSPEASARTGGWARAGGVLELPVAGARSGLGVRDVYVYLPPQYFSEQHATFPVVYLLHGSPGRPQDWLRAGGAVAAGSAVAAAGEPLILVMPPMSHNWLDDSECVDGRDGKWDTWLARDVVPAVDSRLRTRPDRRDRALAGMSAGGYCSLNLLVRHSHDFSVALDLSGYTAPTRSGGPQSLFGHHWRSSAAANTPATFMQTHPLAKPLAVWFIAGVDDPTPSVQLRRLEPELLRNGVAVVSTRIAGGHTYHVWVPALRYGLRWVADRFYGRHSATALQ